MFVLPRFRMSYGKARILIAFPRTYITSGNYVFPGSQLGLQHQSSITYTHSHSVDENLFAGTEVITNLCGRREVMRNKQNIRNERHIPGNEF